MPSIRRLIWDTFNVAHIARHNVTPEEVEEVCHGTAFFSENTYKGRLRVIGSNAAGRLLTVILAPQGRGIYYPVTARTASRKERRQYREQNRDTTP
jgi:uncharacterized protein